MSKEGSEHTWSSQPHLLWSPLTTLRSHLLLRSDALLVSFPPSWVVQVLESLISSCDSRGTANLEEQKFCEATGKLVRTHCTCYWSGECRRAAVPWS